MTTANETKSLALFPEVLGGSSYDKRIFCDADQLEAGYIDEYGEFHEDEESDASRFNWWTGSNTDSRYCWSSELEFIDVEVVSRKTITKGTYQRYETIYRETSNGNLWLEISDNIQQNMKPQIMSLDETEIEELADDLNEFWSL